MVHPAMASVGWVNNAFLSFFVGKMQRRVKRPNRIYRMKLPDLQDNNQYPEKIISVLVCFGMKCGMGVPPMIAFSHGQDARAWGLAISQKPLSRNILCLFVLLNPLYVTVCRAIK
jgi:hypothetical protein